MSLNTFLNSTFGLKACGSADFEQKKEALMESCDVLNLFKDYVVQVFKFQVEDKEYSFKDIKKLFKKTLEKQIKIQTKKQNKNSSESEDEKKTDPKPNGSSNPTKSKRPLSKYILFCQENRPKVKDAFPGISSQDVVRRLGEMWNKQKDQKEVKEDKKEENVEVKDTKQTNEDRLDKVPWTSKITGKAIDNLEKDNIDVHKLRKDIYNEYVRDIRETCVEDWNIYLEQMDKFIETYEEFIFQDVDSTIKRYSNNKKDRLFLVKNLGGLEYSITLKKIRKYRDELRNNGQ